MRKERGKEHTPRKNPKKIQQKKRHQLQLNLKRTETTDETPPVRGKLKKELKKVVAQVLGKLDCFEKIAFMMDITFSNQNESIHLLTLRAVAMLEYMSTETHLYIFQTIKYFLQAILSTQLHLREFTK